MTTWYVRPNTSHSSTRNGTSYNTAWGGWSEIVWASILAGDELFVCGQHSYVATIAVGAHGGSASSRVVIRGDMETDPGRIVFPVGGIYFTPRSHTELKNLGITGVSRCILTFNALVNHFVRGCVFNGGINPIFMMSASNGINNSDISFIDNIFIGGGCLNAPGSAAAIDWFCAATGAVSTVTRITISGNKFIDCNPTGNGRGVVGLRTEEDVSTSSIVTDLIFEDNSFVNCRGYVLEASDGHTFGAASPQYGLWKGARIRRNKIFNSQTDATGNLGGAFSVFGFDNSTTPSFGKNIIELNYVNGAAGQAGGANVCYGTSIVQDNHFENLTTTSIDACGVLIDDGAKDCIVRRNFIRGLPGKNGTINSGAAIMILNADNARIYGNISDNINIGIFFGNVGAGKNNYVENNTFVSCGLYGIFMSAGTNRSGCFVRNNIFTNDETKSPLYVKVNGASWTGEDYNLKTPGFLPNDNHTNGANDLTGDPLIDKSYMPSFSSPVIKSGVYSQTNSDFTGKYFSNPPSIGARQYRKSRRAR